MVNKHIHTHRAEDKKKKTKKCVILKRLLIHRAHFNDCRAEEVVTRLDMRPTSKALL